MTEPTSPLPNPDTLQRSSISLNMLQCHCQCSGYFPYRRQCPTIHTLSYSMEKPSIRRYTILTTEVCLCVCAWSCGFLAVIDAGLMHDGYHVRPSTALVQSWWRVSVGVIPSMYICLAVCFYPFPSILQCFLILPDVARERCVPIASWLTMSIFSFKDLGGQLGADPYQSIPNPHIKSLYFQTCSSRSSKTTNRVTAGQVDLHLLKPHNVTSMKA